MRKWVSRRTACFDLVNVNKNMNMNMNGVYYFKVYTELLYVLREDVIVRKKTILGGTLLTLSVMRSPGNLCYWKTASEV